jgi:uridine kinase
VPLTLPPEEPEAGPWRRVALTELLSLLLAAAGTPTGRPTIVAVDGRGASGKSTLANRLHALVPASATVHIDDLAWHEPLFGSGHLLADDVLRPLHAGRSISYRPPRWAERGREGSIIIPAGLDLVLVEGTGASHEEHADLIDTTVWVQADVTEAERRGLARDIASGVNGDAEHATAFWHDWMREEVAFLARQQPWRRADVVVNGTSGGSPDAEQVVIATPER